MDAIRVRRTLATLIVLSCSLPLSAQEPPSVSVPMHVINNRAFVPVTVSGPHGKKMVQFWVDSGGGIVALSGHLARSLGLAWTGQSVEGMGDGVFHRMTPANLSIAGFALDLGGSDTAANVTLNSSTVFAGIEADGFLPARVLKNYDVIFDYPRSTFTIGKPGSLSHRGSAYPLAVQQTSGFARVEVSIGTAPYGFMLDTGTAYSGISATLLRELHSAHPTWPHQFGAIGAANMVGKSFDTMGEMLVVPLLVWGPFAIENAGFVSRPPGLYEQSIRQEMSAPIIGVLAGNVLRQFRLELDYPDQTVYLQRADAITSETLNCVGVIVRVKDNGEVEISGTVVQNDIPEVGDIRPGDRLLQVDGHPVTGLPLSGVLQLLSGKAGATKALTVLREGKMLKLTAPVRKHLAT